jgi:hypothetical protein
MKDLIELVSQDFRIGVQASMDAIAIDQIVIVNSSTGCHCTTLQSGDEPPMKPVVAPKTVGEHFSILFKASLPQQLARFKDDFDCLAPALGVF